MLLVSVKGLAYDLDSKVMGCFSSGCKALMLLVSVYGVAYDLDSKVMVSVMHIHIVASEALV